jgi:hypothetical protein
MKRQHNEHAVTETMYVMLILAVTVFVGSLIAAFVFGMPGASLQNTKIIALSAEQSGSDILVRYYGNVNDDPGLAWLTITAPNGTVFTTVSTSGALGTEGIPVKPVAGTVMTLSGAATPGTDHVIVVGSFSDHTAQVVLEKFL